MISYQAAVKHLFDPLWSLQTALFYRDLFDLVGARNVRPTVDVARLVYENVDNGHALGFEVTLDRIDGEKSRVELDYTWMSANGTQSREEGVPFGPVVRSRPESNEQHPLDWDRRHSISLAALIHRGNLSVGWTTAVGSPLPWTPAETRSLESDLTSMNSRRIAWEETSALSLRWTAPRLGQHLTVGLDVQNVFNRKNEIATTLDGYPNPAINTIYDDDSAYRTATGLPGGGYYNDANNDGIPGWVPLNDPRLFSAPRAIRAFVGTDW
jgi:hypothetical protein